MYFFRLIWISLLLLSGICLPQNLVLAKNDFEDGKCGFLGENHLKDGLPLPWVATLNTRTEEVPDATHPAILLSPSLVLMNANLFLERGLIKVMKFFNLTSYSVSANLTEFGATHEDDANIQTVRVKQIRIHPEFKGRDNWTLYQNDIALIHVDPPFKFDSGAHAICIPTEEIGEQIMTISKMENSNKEQNSSVLLFGWKRYKSTNIFLRMKVNDQSTCKKWWLEDEETKYSKYDHRFCANVSTENTHNDCIHKDNGMVGKFGDKYYFLGLVNNFYSDNRICTSNARFFVLQATENSDLNFINNNLRCGPDNFTCTNGRCISLENWCDGDDDCEDNSDETDARCEAIVHPYHCVGGEDHCGEKGKCIRVNQFCDGVKDCPKGEDESEARCPPKKIQKKPDCCSEAGTCKDAFIESPEINGKVFLIPTDERTGHWLKNFGLCRKHCAEMVTLHSSEENDAFINWFRNFIPSGDKNKTPTWLGGRFPFIENIYDDRWYWFSGVPVNASFHPNLNSWEPQDRGNNICLTAMLAKDSNNIKLWYAYPCDNAAYFACQRNVTID